MKSAYRSFFYGVAILLIFLANSISAQTPKPPAISILFAQLTKSLDSKTSAIGEEIELITLKDLLVDKQLVIPKGSKIRGSIAGLVQKGKDEPKTSMAIRIEKVIVGNGQDIPLQAIIAAVAAPAGTLESDPTYAMMHSNEPKMTGSAQSTSNTGSLSASSKATSNAAVATAQIKGNMDDGLLLNENSQGAIGYEDLEIAWHLAMPPPLTIFATKGKTLKLQAGTQMLLRMAEPRIPK